MQLSLTQSLFLLFVIGDLSASDTTDQAVIGSKVRLVIDIHDQFIYDN